MHTLGVGGTFRALAAKPGSGPRQSATAAVGAPVNRPWWRGEQGTCPRSPSSARPRGKQQPAGKMRSSPWQLSVVLAGCRWQLSTVPAGCSGQNIGGSRLHWERPPGSLLMPPFPQSLQRVKAHGAPSGPTGAPVLPESLLLLCISSGWPDSSRGEGWSLPQGLSHQAAQDVSFVTGTLGDVNMVGSPGTGEPLSSLGARQRSCSGPWTGGHSCLSAREKGLGPWC